LRTEESWIADQPEQSEARPQDRGSQAAPPNGSKIALLTAGHAASDLYAAFLAGLLPVLIDRLLLSKALVGGLSTIMSFGGNYSQVVWGYLGDKLGRRWLVGLGIVISSVFMVLLGRVTSYTTAAAAVALGGIGVALFHPLAAAMAGSVGGRAKGLGMSLFSAGGNVGFALGPLFAAFAFTQFGGRGMWVAAIPGLLVAAALLAWAPPLPGSVHRERGSTRRALRPHLGALLLVFLVVTGRAGTVISFHTFIPVLLKERGASLQQCAQAIGLFIFTGAVFGLLGGHLSDRLGRRRVTFWSMLLATPALLSFLHLRGSAALPLLALGGGMLHAAVAVNIVMAQAVVPEKASVASSIAMGLAWGTGGLLPTPLGMLADRFSTHAALTLVACVPLLAALCCLAMPARQKDEG